MTIEFNGHKIEVYDNTQNLPILRFQKFNKYLMLANEVGNSFEDYDARTAKALQFLQKNMVTEAIQELNNRRQAVFNAYNEYSPAGRGFAILVKKIDDKVYTGISPDELDEVLRHLEKVGIGYDMTLKTMTEIKKKSNWNLRYIFRAFFPRSAAQTIPL